MKRNEEYLEKGMDLKRLALCFQKKLWLFVMMTIVGATLGGIVYQVVRAIQMPVAYEAVSKLYISFHVDESGEVYQYYNGYTWNELLDTDPILDQIMEKLSGEYTKDEVIGATTAEILSDIRLLTIKVEGSTEKFVREIMEAVENGLVEYAEESEELKRIENIRSNPPERIFWDDRTTQACVTGAVIFAVVVLMVMAFVYALDEAVYVQEDAEKKYTCKVLGLTTRNQKGLQPYARELKSNIHYVLGDLKKFAVLDMGNHGDVRKLEIETLLNKNENDLLSGGEKQDEFSWSQMEADEKEKAPEEEYEIVPFNENMISEEECCKIRELGGTVILIPFGADVGRKTQRILSLLNNQDCKLLGIVITQADEEFLNRYYG